MLGDIKKERKQDVLYSLYLKQNEDSSFEAIVAREGKKFTRFEAESPRQAEAIFETYVHCKNDFEMRKRAKDILWGVGKTVGAVVGMSVLGFYAVSLMSQQLFGTGNAFFDAYWAADAYCAQNPLLDMLWDGVIQPVAFITSVLYPLDLSGDVLRGLASKVHDRKQARNRKMSRGVSIEEHYEKRL